MQNYGWWTAILRFDLGPVHLGTGGISIVPVAMVLGLLLLILLVGWEAIRTSRSRVTLIDLELFRVRRFGLGNVVALVVSLGEFGILFVLPLWIQSVHGYRPARHRSDPRDPRRWNAQLGGRGQTRVGRIGATAVVRLGMVLEMVGIVAIGFTLSVDRSPWWLAIPLVVYGLGVGFATAQLTNVVLEDVPPKRSGQASAMTSTFRQIGSALGAACLGAILFSTLGSNLSDSTHPGNRTHRRASEARSPTRCG